VAELSGRGDFNDINVEQVVRAALLDQFPADNAKLPELLRR
jgi:hypothetical protein